MGFNSGQIVVISPDLRDEERRSGAAFRIYCARKEALL